MASESIPEKSLGHTSDPDIPQDNAKQEAQYLTGFKLAIFLASTTFVFFLALLDMSIIGTAIPQITTEFHSIPDIGWYIGAYSLAAATLQPLSGKLYSEFRTKWIYLSFLFSFELGSLICGVAPSSMVFIIGRAIAGLGASGLANGCFTMLSASVPREKSPMYFGALMGFGQMGIVTGPLLGGALTEHATWRWCFYINLPIGGIAAAIIAFMHVPEATKKDDFSLDLIRRTLPKLDLPGFALFVPPSIMFLLALQFGSGNTYAWDSATIIGLLCGAVAALIVFIFWEHRIGTQAMLPGYLLKQRVVWASCIYGACSMCTTLVASNWMPTYFQAVRGESPTTSGVHVLPTILSQLVCVIVSGALISRLGFYFPWAFFGAAITAIGNGLVSTFSPTTSVARWIGFQIIMGAGRGMGMQTAIIAIQSTMAPASMPIAISLLMLFQNLSVSVGVVISNVIFSQTLSRAIPRYAPSIAPQAALDAGSGAAAVRKLVLGHEEELMGVLMAYSEALRNIFYFLVAFSGVGLVASLGMGWVDVRKKAAKPAEDVSVA